MINRVIKTFDIRAVDVFMSFDKFMNSFNSFRYTAITFVGYDMFRESIVSFDRFGEVF
jgi:hypothetical protein